MTITEALAEIKTIEKRINSKREFIKTYAIRIESLKDPLEKDGGSAKLIEQEFQAIDDLEQRLVKLRREIAFKNDLTFVEVEGVNNSIAHWLVWRREVAPRKRAFLSSLRQHILMFRDQARRQYVHRYTKDDEIDQQLEVIVNVREQELAQLQEKFENILGQLDGKLSLKNATVTLDV
jgi:DNA repair exonuclease SbcCD ATPase subunit